MMGPVFEPLNDTLEDIDRALVCLEMTMDLDSVDGIAVLRKRMLGIFLSGSKLVFLWEIEVSIYSSYLSKPCRWMKSRQAIRLQARPKINGFDLGSKIICSTTFRKPLTT